MFKDNSLIYCRYRTKKKPLGYPLEIGFRQVKVSELAYEPETVRGYCQSCPNYSRVGSCPPAAPPLEELAAPEDELVLVYARLTGGEPEGNSEAVPVWWLQDRVLSGFLTKLGRTLTHARGGWFLGPGRCRACRTCYLSRGEEECRHPERRAYSFSAAGILAQETVKRVFGFDLMWGNGKKEPLIVTKLIAVFPNESWGEFNLADMMKAILELVPGSLTTVKMR